MNMCVTVVVCLLNENPRTQKIKLNINLLNVILSINFIVNRVCLLTKFDYIDFHNLFSKKRILHKIKVHTQI
jgi:hypothetical protein